MKLLAKSINKDFIEMFTPANLYEIELLSPNRKMVLVTLDNGLPCQVLYQNSVYGEFELVE